MSYDPIRRCTLLVLFQSQQDNATELVIGPSTGGGAPIKYRVGSAWCDWKAPDPDFVPGARRRRSLSLTRATR